MSVISALEDWNPWWREEDNGVPPSLKGKPRELISTIEPFINDYKIKILVGIRRSGKSTLLYQLIDHLLRSGKVSPNEILLVNFEDLRLSTESAEKIFEIYLEHLRPKNHPHVFLDEVHNIDSWTRMVRRLGDLKKAHFYLTDSSSFFIPSELQPILTGRKVTFEVFPLSFQEYLSFKNIELNKIWGTEEKIKIRGILREYIERGGFPEPFFYPMDAARKIIAEYFEDIVTRDLVARYRMPSMTTKQLVLYLMSNPAQRFSYRKLSNVFRTGVETMQHYINNLQNIFLFFKVTRYTTKLKDQFISPKKLYPIDTSMVNVVGFKVSENLGPLLELIVFLQLRRKHASIYYYQESTSGKEVDFVVTQGNSIKHLINVSVNLEESNTRRREISGLVKAMKTLKTNESTIITWDTEEIISINANKKIRVVPAWKWLLQQ